MLEILPYWVTDSACRDGGLLIMGEDAADKSKETDEMGTQEWHTSICKIVCLQVKAQW